VPVSRALLHVSLGDHSGRALQIVNCLSKFL
jgi:hypothetical protein